MSRRFSGSSLRGYIDISYDELVAKLGPPDSNGDGYKVDAEWMRESESGVAFTIYNYKDGPNYTGGGSVQMIREWHIGGFGPEAVEVVRQLFPDHEVTK